MISYRNKAIIYMGVILLCLGLLPMQGYAKVYLETELVSGTITAIRDNAVELDGKGIFYYPANKKMQMDLRIGEVVTLRYYVDMTQGDSINKYVEYAPGRDSLAPILPPENSGSKPRV